MPHYLCSENKGADQSRGDLAADLHLSLLHKADFAMTRLILSYKVSSVFVTRVAQADISQLHNLACHMSRVMRKPAFCICENKDADQLRGSAPLLVQSLFFLNPKFQATSHLLWLYSLVCVGPGRKPRRPVFSQRG